MIVNPWTVSSLSLDIASAGLGLIAAIGAVKQFRTTTKRLPETGERLAESEDHLYLLFWIGAVFLFLRFLAWPLFYFSLHSIIPEVAGAMCIFGTRNLQPVLTKSLELVKPLLFFTGLVWLLVFRLERFFYQSGSGSKARKSSLILLSFCLLGGLIDSIGSAALWIQSNAELAVSCCTTITDIPSRFTVWIPSSLFGHEYQSLLWWLFYGSNILLICVALLMSRQVGKGVLKTAFLFLSAGTCSCKYNHRNICLYRSYCPAIDEPALSPLYVLYGTKRHGCTCFCRSFHCRKCVAWRYFSCTLTCR